MLHDPWFYAAAIPAVVLVGLSKGGFGGGGLLGAPLLALVIPPLEAAAIMLPIMIVMDLVALHAWWGVFDRRSVATLIPASIAGILIGWAIAAYVSDDAVKLIVGAVALGFILNYLLGGARRGVAREPNRVKGAFWGTVGGFTSFVSHAGGPPMQMYLLPLRLDSKVLAGTTVLVFAATNFVKLLPYAMLGQFSSAHLTASAVLLPLAPIATWFGARLVRRIKPETFYRVTYTVLFLVSLKLLYDGAMGVL
jgi:uncharacterized membrane protein YfcA